MRKFLRLFAVISSFLMLGQFVPSQAWCQTDAVEPESSYLEEEAETVQSEAAREEEARGPQPAAAGQAGKRVIIEEPEDIYQMPIEDITKSEAAKYFKEGNYEKALEEFQLLAKLYPRDITIRRYIGICYDRLGKYDEAIEAYNEGLLLYPYHVPTHFYKGLAFIRKGDLRRGLNELKFVSGADPEGPYGERARTIITQIEAGRPIVPEKPKPWTYFGRAAWMYDDNVPIAPKEKALRVPNSDLNAMRYELDGTFLYQMFQESKTRVNFEYGWSVSLNDDSLTDFNFYLQRAAISVSFINEFLGKQWLNTFRHDFSAGWLDDAIFSIANTSSVSAATSFFNQTRTTFFSSFGYTEFGPDGFDAKALSRDGFYESAGLDTTWFTKDGAFFVALGYAWNGAQTRGKDFVLSAHSVQFRLHTPVIEKFYADFSAAYLRGDYPDFDGKIFVDVKGRRDDAWTMAVFLSRPLTKNITWRAFYRWFDTQNNNDIFAFRRDIAGCEINFQI